MVLKHLQSTTLKKGNTTEITTFFSRTSENFHSFQSSDWDVSSHCVIYCKLTYCNIWNHYLRDTPLLCLNCTRLEKKNACTDARFSEKNVSKAASAHQHHSWEIHLWWCFGFDEFWTASVFNPVQTLPGSKGFISKSNGFLSGPAVIKWVSCSELNDST